MPIEVVWCHVHLIGISHRSNLHRLPNTVPNRINDCDIYCLILKVRREAAATKQYLAGANSVNTMIAHMGQTFGTWRIDLKPEQSKVFQPSSEPQIAFGLGIEV